MHDQVPHIERIDGNDVWMAAGERLGAPGYYSMAGWDGVMPVSIPKTFDEIPPTMYDADGTARVPRPQGIQAQVLYPNVGGFGNGYFLRLGDRELVAGCVRAYNDFLTDWCSADPDRLLAVTALPFWDVDFAIAELHRCVAQRPSGGELLQPAAGLRPAAAGPHALGSDVGGGAGSGRVGQLPRRRWLDGHPVRRHRRDGLDDELRQGLVVDLPRQHALHRPT